MLDKSVVNSLNALTEKDRFFRGLVQWMKYPTAQITFNVPERSGGKTQWNRIKLIKYAISNISAFSSAPLQIVTWLGLSTLFIGLIFCIISLIQKLEGKAIDGFTTIIFLLSLFSGTIMVSIGILGHYLARIYEELKDRPSYLIKKQID